MRKTNRNTTATENRDELQTRLIKTSRNARTVVLILDRVFNWVSLISILLSSIAITVMIHATEVARANPETATLGDSMARFLPAVIGANIIFLIMIVLAWLVIGSIREDLDEVVEAQDMYFHDK